MSSNNNPPPAGSSQPAVGQFKLKNLLDLPDDTIVYNSNWQNPISYVQQVVGQTAQPNPFRTRKQYYGRFILELYKNGEWKQGDAMFDPVLSAIKRAGGEIPSVDKMQLFVAIVYVEELQHYPMPAKDNMDAIFKIAVNGGIFKSYVYSGEKPVYGDNVLVSFADPATRTEGIFEMPLVGGASGGAVGGSGSGGSSSRGVGGSCRERRGYNGTTQPENTDGERLNPRR